MFTLLMQKVPIFMRWVKYLSFVFYGFRLLEKIQYSRHQTYSCSTGCESIENSPALRGLELNSGIEEAWVLLLMAVGYRVISYMCLRRIWSTKNKMELWKENTCWPGIFMSLIHWRVMWPRNWHSKGLLSAVPYSSAEFEDPECKKKFRVLEEDNRSTQVLSGQK